jgi:hypothetical protein
VASLHIKKTRLDTVTGRHYVFGYLKDLVELLDSHNIPMLSMMGIERSKKGGWYIILRLRTEDASAVAEDLRQNGFNVTDVT